MTVNALCVYTKAIDRWVDGRPLSFMYEHEHIGAYDSLNCKTIK